MNGSELMIGWACKDVSSERPVNIPGQFHMRISQGILDPVTVSALAVSDGRDIAIFVSCDTCIIFSSMLEKVRAKISAINPEIPVEKILFNSTHTHAGPGYWGVRLGVKSQYSTFATPC